MTVGLVVFFCKWWPDPQNKSLHPWATSPPSIFSSSMNVHTFPTLNLSPSHPPHACSKWRDELLMSDGLAVRGVLCPCFQLADVKRLCVYIYYNLVYELWHGESCLFFGLQRFKRILLVSSPPPSPRNGFPFSSPFSSSPLFLMTASQPQDLIQC